MLPPVERLAIFAPCGRNGHCTPGYNPAPPGRHDARGFELTSTIPAELGPVADVISELRARVHERELDQAAERLRTSSGGEACA